MDNLSSRNIALVLWCVMERKIQSFREGEHEIWMEGYIHMSPATANALLNRITELEMDNKRLEHERLQARAAAHAGTEPPYEQQH